MDKLGERLAFERSRTRLFDALMVKCAADASKIVPANGIKHIRDEEAMHFALVGAAMQSLGGGLNQMAELTSVLAGRRP